MTRATARRTASAETARSGRRPGGRRPSPPALSARPAAACACGGGCPRCTAAPAQGLLLQRQDESEQPRAPAASPSACTPTHSFPVGLGRVDITFPLGSAGPLTERDRRSLDAYESLWRDAQRSALRASFRIDGFADSTEPAASQMPLSCERAQIVSEDLEDRGIPPSEIALFSHGGSDRFDPRSNRRAAVFIDAPQASGIASAEQRQQEVIRLDELDNDCTVAGTPAYRHTRAGHLVIDLGGEGCIAEANNVNPSPTRTCGIGLVGTPIPDHVCGVNESIPIGDDTVDLLSVESIPLSVGSYREIARVMRPDGTVCLRGFGDEDFEGMRDALQDAGHRVTPAREGSLMRFRLGGARNNGLSCEPPCLCRGLPP